MFEEPDIYMFDAIQQLCIHKIVYESTGQTCSDSIDGDCMYGDALDAIYFCAPIVESWYDEYCDNSVYKITFDKMHEFFELCRKQAHQQGIAFENHPLVKKANEAVNHHMYNTNSYCIDWHTYIPKKLGKKKSYCLFFEVSCEFYNYVGLVDSLYSIRDYFIEAEKRLRKEMELPKSIKIPKQYAQQTRRAA